MSKYRSMRQRKKLDARAAMLRCAIADQRALDALVEFTSVWLPRWQARVRRYFEDEFPAIAAIAAENLREALARQVAYLETLEAKAGESNVPAGKEGDR